MNELLRKSDLWKQSYKDTTIEIVRWNFDSGNSRMPWKENWNYYVYLYEKHCTDFESLWLPDIVKSFSAGGTEYISHDYYSKFGDIEMHGGITFYDKHGYSEGHRCVQVGCDYQHLYDEGQRYSAECILREAQATAEECIRLFYREPAIPVPALTEAS